MNTSDTAQHCTFLLNPASWPELFTSLKIPSPPNPYHCVLHNTELSTLHSTTLDWTFHIAQCFKRLHKTVSVLWQEEGYTVKYSLSSREIPRAEPEGFPEGSGYISPYIPTWVIIQTFSICKRFTQVLSFVVGKFWKIWFSVLVWQLGLVIENGLIRVKEEGWTGFSDGWQGCSEGFPEGEAQGKSQGAALPARGKPRPSRLFYSDLHSI